MDEEVGMAHCPVCGSSATIVTLDRGSWCDAFEITMASGSVREAARGMRKYGWELAVHRVLNDLAEGLVHEPSPAS